MGAPGKIIFLMHAHLPFVRHPDYKRFFEENWSERLTEGVREEKRKYAWSNMTEAIEKLRVGSG